MSRAGTWFFVFWFIFVVTCLPQTRKLGEMGLSDSPDTTETDGPQVRIEKKDPWVVQVIVMNNSPAEITLNGLTLYLSALKVGSASGSTPVSNRRDYYAPVNLETRKALALRRTTKAGGTPVETIEKVASQNTAVLTINMRDLKWGCTICANWPYQSFDKAVEAGDYELYVQVSRQDSEIPSKSNILSFTVPIESRPRKNAP